MSSIQAQLLSQKVVKKRNVTARVSVALYEAVKLSLVKDKKTVSKLIEASFMAYLEERKRGK